MMLETVFAALYRYLRLRRPLLLSVALLLLLGGGWAMTGLRQSEDARVFLPDDDSRVARDFELLQQGPLARKLVVSLAATGETSPERLPAVGRELAEELSRDGSMRISANLPLDGRKIYSLLLQSYPLLLEEEDLDALTSRYSAVEIDQRLREARRELLGPDGWGMKEALRLDPLGLHRSTLERLRYLNLAVGAEIRQGQMVSADGRHLLLFGETDIPMTDAAGARRLVERFRAVAADLPPGFEADLISGHRYTLGNAETVQQDLKLILPTVTVALLLLLLLLLRSFAALPALLLPLAAVVLTIGLFALLKIPVSGITIGFAAVVLGMAVDFGVHVFYALRSKKSDPATAVGQIARPVLYGALTTIGAFAVLGGSSLPLQRQLALFAGCGLSISVLLALVLLPQLLPQQSRPMAVARREPAAPRSMKHGGLVIAVWLLLLGLALWQAVQVRIDGDLRSLNLVTPELAAAEQRLKDVWGDLRGRALLFSEGDNLQEALQTNDKLFRRLAREFPPGEAASLAPLLPSAHLQERRRLQWQNLWNGTDGQLLSGEMQRRQGDHGFSAMAFEPFYQSLVGEMPGVDQERLLEAGFAPLMEEMIMAAAGPVRVLSLAPDQADLAQRLDLESLGVHLVSPMEFSRQLNASIGADLIRFVSWGAVLVVALLLVLFRRIRTTLAALAPALTGLGVMFGVMGGYGLSFNLFNVVAVVLVLGLTVDYGIFMVWSQTRKVDHATRRAVVVSGVTTLAGFGSLVLGQHPALFSIGLTVLLGVGAALPTAYWVVPALLGRADEN